MPMYEEQFVTARFSRPPTVATDPAMSLSPTSESLDGSVDPNGESVSECRFEYGLTTAYGSTVPCAGTIGEGETATPVSATIAGLKPGTEYHYRVVAVGAGGTSESADEVFTTEVFGITTTSLPEGTLYTKTNKAWSLAAGSHLPQA